MFVVVVTPGTVMAPAGQKLTPTVVNLAASPTVTVTGNLADLTNVDTTAPAGGQSLVYDSGLAKWKAGEARAMVGATGAADGTAGTTPKPLAGENGKFLRGDGTWQPIVLNPSSLDMFNWLNFY